MLISLLSFAGLLQAGRRWAAGHGDTLTSAADILTVRLVDLPAQASLPVRLAPSAADVQRASIGPHMPDAGPALGYQPAPPYVPVAELSQRPLLLQDIDDLVDLASAGIAGPAIPALPEVTAILLINEHGAVDHLQFESVALPYYLENLLAQRFADARFIPGKIDGKPVRSALRIVLQWQ